jgi:hypothetical protein
VQTLRMNQGFWRRPLAIALEASGLRINRV